jgi:pectin methylesterase-like acyl-CoA thioesterase
MAHGFGVCHLLVVLAAAFVIAVPVLAIESSNADAWIKAVENKPQGGVTTESAGTSRTIVVAQSGPANFRNVQSAINAVPNGNKQRVIIVIGPGVYRFKLVTMSLRCLQDSQKSHSWNFPMTALCSVM